MWLKSLMLLLVCKQGLSQCFNSSPNVATCTMNTISASNLKRMVRNLDNLNKLLVFANPNCREVDADSFRSTRNLEYIKIQDCQLNELHEETFSNLPIKIIELSRNRLEFIVPRTFINLPKLSSISLRHNDLRIIQRGAFANLPVKKLTFSHNRISLIEDYALENLYNLRKLELDNNNLCSIRLHKAISHPEYLEILWLHNNSITSVTRSMLQGLTNLKLLNLGFNRIDSVEKGSFDATARLETLVLTHNRLKEIDGDVFPAQGMNLLRYLYLSYNKLMFLNPDFFSGLNALQKVTLIGNPWFCSCYDKISDLLSRQGIAEECLNGYYKLKIPLCIANGDSAYMCPYVYDSRLSEKYFKYIKNDSVSSITFP